MRHLKSLRAALGLFAVFALLVGGTFALTAPAPIPPEAMVASAQIRGSAVLDGLVFTSKVGRAGAAADITDELIFADGLFLSAECERRCNYPARPYFVREKGGRVEFISETRCPNKDATLVWRGTIDGRSIKGEFTWTSSRWYWTVERTFWFEGELSEKVASIRTL